MLWSQTRASILLFYNPHSRSTFFYYERLLATFKSGNNWVFFRKRAIKVLIPLAVWSVIYLIWKKEGFEKDFLSLIATYLIRILNRPNEDHLWFLYALMGLYLFTPILRLYLQKASQQEQFYYLGVWFFFATIVFFLAEFTPIKIGIYYQYLSGYVGYFLFGHFARNFNMQKKHRVIAWIIFAFGLALTITGMWYCKKYEIKSFYFEDYLSANVTLMSCAFFILLKDLHISDSLYKFIAPLNRASFGIYLVHIMVMAELYRTGGPLSDLTKMGHELYMVPALGISVFLISLFIILALQKIPFLKRIVP
ncbi:MAG: acyltransferase family protein [Anaerolineales bacterium]|nr:acyltransferase family protein [Anaerolineales bacterium]